MRVTYVGHATVLHRGGRRAGVDRPAPAVTRVPSPAPRAGERRARWSVDAILVSHAHWDHLDLPSLKRVAEHSSVIVVPRGSAKHLRRGRFAEIVEIDVGEEVADRPRSRVTATHAEHDGRRAPFGDATPSLGYIVSGSTRTYFAGDTDLFAEMAALAPLDLALLPISGWGPRLPRRTSRPTAGGRGAPPPRASRRGADPLGHVLGHDLATAATSPGQRRRRTSSGVTLPTSPRRSTCMCSSPARRSSSRDPLPTGPESRGCPQAVTIGGGSMTVDGTDQPRGDGTRKKPGKRRLIGTGVAVAVVAATFVFVLPRIADYREVWGVVEDAFVDRHRAAAGGDRAQPRDVRAALDGRVAGSPFPAGVRRHSGLHRVDVHRARRPGRGDGALVRHAPRVGLRHTRR